MNFYLIEAWPEPVKMIIYVLAICIGVFALVKASDVFVDSSCVIAKKLKVPSIIIGLTIVSFGTSAPELAVSVSDSITTMINGGNANVAIGNVVGSNICNILLVLGCSAIFTPIMVKKSLCKKEYPFLIGVTILCLIFGLFFGLNTVFDGKDFAIVRIEGAILVIGIIIYVVMLIKGAKKGDAENEEAEHNIKDMSMVKAIILTIIGLAGIVIGGEAVVYGAKNMAYSIGSYAKIDHDIVESLVGLTIVAVGTSLPELVTSVVAAKKGENDIALGNVIGSNIFNILFVLGLSSVVNPLTTGSQIVVDLLVMNVSTLIVFFMCLKGKISKKGGLFLILLYCCYVGYLILRTFLH